MMESCGDFINRIGAGITPEAAISDQLLQIRTNPGGRHAEIAFGVAKLACSAAFNSRRKVMYDGIRSCCSSGVSDVAASSAFSGGSFIFRHSII